MGGHPEWLKATNQKAQDWNATRLHAVLKSHPTPASNTWLEVVADTAWQLYFVCSMCDCGSSGQSPLGSQKLLGDSQRLLGESRLTVEKALIFEEFLGIEHDLSQCARRALHVHPV